VEGECPDGFTQFNETEPNDDGASVETMNDIGPQSSSFCIVGDAVCGNDGSGFTGDLDFILFEGGTNEGVSFSLSWGGSNTDMDGLLQEVETEAVVHDFEEGFTPETGSFALAEGNTYVLRVGCWEGQDGRWVAAFEF